MSWSFPIAHLFGTQPRGHVTFLRLIGFVGAWYCPSEEPEPALSAALFILLLLAGVMA